MTKLIFGCGYLGQRVARKWRELDQHVVAVTRSEARSLELASDGLISIGADVTRPDSLKCLRHPPSVGGHRIDCVLFSVGFDPTSGRSIHEVYAEGVRNVLTALPVSVERFIYISTTGVYGPGHGAWVDEETPPDPRREGGRASLAAEEALAAHPVGKNSVVLRLAGIYGPSRVPFIDKLRAGEPIPAPITGHLNLIHIDDAARVVVAAAQLAPFENGPRIYCVSDGHPVKRGEFYREVARQIGARPPRFVDPEPNATRALRAQSDRRVGNEKMLSEMAVKLIYPDYRIGLAAVLETQNQ